MKVKRITPRVAALPLRRPMKTGGSELTSVENIFVRIETDDGIVGWGEASAAPRMTGETTASIMAAIDYLTPALQGRDLAQMLHRMIEVHQLVDLLRFDPNRRSSAPTRFQIQRATSATSRILSAVAIFSSRK